MTSDDIRSISVDAYDNSFIWLATYGGGICNLHDEIWSVYNTTNQLTKSDSLDFIESVFSFEVTGFRYDSVYVTSPFGNINFLDVIPEIFHPIGSASRNRGNGFWLWINTENDIYRGDFTEGISPVLSETSQWTISIQGHNVQLFTFPLQMKC